MYLVILQQAFILKCNCKDRLTPPPFFVAVCCGPRLEVGCNRLCHRSVFCTLLGNIIALWSMISCHWLFRVLLWFTVNVCLDCQVTLTLEKENCIITFERVTENKNSDWHRSLIIIKFFLCVLFFKGLLDYRNFLLYSSGCLIHCNCSTQCAVRQC